ncbi:MAG: acyloxyacyl hydrolase [Opitutaceae bacterium]
MPPSCLRAFALVLFIAGGVSTATRAQSQPWATSAVSLESGLLWGIGTGTPLSYRLIPTQLSWRSPEIFGRPLGDGRVVLRHRFTLLGTLVQQGPEHRYVALDGSPSIEWWNKAGTWNLYGGAGGGFGWLDSQGVKGAQGQDFTFNWFARGGIEHTAGRHSYWSAGVMFQHMSNGGQTKPNPGIDALGFTAGWTRRF